MNRDAIATVVGGVGLGLGVMYFLDPRSGRRRRGSVRDRLAHEARRVARRLATFGENLANRSVGQCAELRARLAGEPVSDAVLIARVRSEMGHVIRNLHLIEVEIENGRVVLRGPIDADKVEPLLHRLAGVPGLPPVDSHLISATRSSAD